MKKPHQGTCSVTPCGDAVFELGGTPLIPLSTCPTSPQASQLVSQFVHLGFALGGSLPQPSFEMSWS